MAVYTGSCGSSVTYTLDTDKGTLEITGAGAMEDYSGSNAPWYEHRSSISEIRFGEGVTTVGKYTAYNSGYISPLKVKLSNTITTIKDFAFAQNTSLTEIVFPVSLTTINSRAFNGCSNLVSIAFKGVQPSMPSTKQGNVTYYRQFYDVGNATVYSSGWASDSVFTTTIRGGATFTYKPLSELPPEYSIIPVNARGVWRKSIPHARVGGVWKKAVAWCKVNGVWKRIGSDFEGYTGLAVFFNANGGEGDMSPILTESSATIPSNAFTRDKYRFSGWNTSPDGTGTTYSAGQTISITSNVTLYAIWIAVYTISFNANGGSGSIASIETEGALTIPSNAFTLSGYAFNGWNTSPDGTGTAYSAGQSITVTSDLTLYAVWIRQYTMSFNANGGTGTIASIVTTSTTATVPANAFSRSGHRFDRWSTAADGSGTTYSAGQTITLTGDITLYAIWIQQFTITYMKKWQGDNMLWHPPSSNTGPVSGGYLDLKVGGATVAGLNDTFPNHTDGYYSPEYSITVDKGTALSVTSKQEVGSGSSVVKRNDANASGPATSVSYDLPGGVQCNLNILMTWRITYSWLGKTTGSWWIIDIWDR